MHERLIVQLVRIREELAAPTTEELLKEIRTRTGVSPQTHLMEIRREVEETIRALELSQANIQQELMEESGELAVEGVPNLPAHLARFLAERKEFPGFSYEVRQDEVRGWVITWKEYTHRGTIRGCGQFYERPYAWLDE
jgi:hypothetical protein